MIGAIASLAWRNIWRNWRRTVITSLSIAFGTAAFLFVQSYLDGINAGFRENLVNGEAGHVRVAAREYFRLERVLPKEHLVQDADGLERDLAFIPAVRHVTGRLKLRLMLGRDGRNEPCVAIGVDPNGEKYFLGLQGKMKQGRYLDGDGAPQGDAAQGVGTAADMIVGDRLAVRLGLRVGDAILAVTSDLNSGTYGLEFKVKGIFATGVRAVDGNVLCIPLTRAQELLDCPGAVHEILLLGDDPDDAPKLAAAVEKVLARRHSSQAVLGSVRQDPLDAVPLQEHWMARYMVLAEKIMNIIVVLLMLVVATVISNTMRMSIMERTHETVVIQSLGMRDRAFRLLILNEAFFIGVLGAGLGCLVGAGLSLLAQHVGFDVSPMLESMDSPVPFMSTVLRPRLLFLFVVEAFVFGLFFAVAAAVRPAFKATAPMPAVALASELHVR
ncbi:MAG: ABC transporter permease [Candidatus Aminicenantes bacterium]|nr:ABC transporter permease [Candidatus Aminicenantes bacterium]